MESATAIERLRAGGIVAPKACVAEAARAGLRLELAAAMLEKESGGGHNVFGHDRDRDGNYIFPARDGTVKVTKELYLEYKRRRVASGNKVMQGVGPCQLTWFSFQDDADKLGGCWKPQLNMRVGFGHLAGLVRAHGDAVGARMYNGAGAAAEAYSVDLLKKAAAWKTRLAGAAPVLVPEPVPLAGYVADSAEGDDLLGVHSDVRALCAVISAKSVVPPLSIGLFGPWGSGKSFFMELMRHEITRISTRPRGTAGDVRGDPFCENVVQIKFNAWHYLDANLWASLMARIWEGLAAHGQGTADEPDDRHKELFKRLETSSALLRSAQRDADDAEQRVSEARSTLDQLAQKRAQTSSALRALSTQDVSREVANEPTVRTAIRRIEREAGLPEGALDLAQVRTIASELHGLGRARVVWTLLRGRGAWRRALVALAVLLLAIAIALLVTQQWVESLAATAAAVLGIVAAAGRAVSAVARPASSLLVGVEAALEHARDAEQERQAEISRSETEHRAELLRLEEEAAVRRSVLAAADERKRDAERAIIEIESGRAVARFIEERATSSDYERHRGLIAMIQRDLETLSALMRPQHDDELLEDDDELLEDDDELLEDDDEPLEDDDHLPQIDRIVLYIDDLDRCPARLVVEVLQAVHLLLAYPLFVVVVGVDPRWLVSSLSRHHTALLGLETALAVGDDEARDWTASPQEYLEKIFQLPLMLRPMDQLGYGRLVRELIPHRRAGETPDPELDDDEPSASGDGDLDEEEEDVEFEPGHANLEIEPEEIEFMERLWPLMRSPRAVKRLSNVYRFIRAQVAPGDLPSFIGQASTASDGKVGEYQAVLLLLAVVTGRPEEAPALIAAIMSGGTQRWGEVLGQVRDVSDSALSALRVASKDLENYPLERMRDWVPVVARFSFSFSETPETLRTAPTERG